MKALGISLIVTALVAVLAFIEGFTIQHLWGWFVVHPFHQHGLSLAEALGLGLLVSLMGNYTYVVYQNKKDSLTSFAIIAARPALMLVGGYFIHLFV